MQPGTLVALDGDGARLATSDGELVITALSTPEGVAVDIAGAFEAHGISVGGAVPSPSPELVTALRDVEGAFARDERFWLDRLESGDPTVLPAAAGMGGARASRTIDLPADADDAAAVAAVALWMARTTSSPTITFAARTPRRARRWLAWPRSSAPASCACRSTRRRRSVTCGRRPERSSTSSRRDARCCATPSAGSHTPAATTWRCRSSCTSARRATAPTIPTHRGGSRSAVAG